MRRLVVLPPLFVGAALFLSWFTPETRALWDQLDKAVFFTFNGSLGSSKPWQIFWALLNFRGADLIPAVLMLALFAHYAFTHQRDALLRYGGIGLAMAIYVVGVIQLSHSIFDDLDRKSPTLVFPGAYLLSELVPWAHPKDRSDTSFPGDHGAVLLMVSGFLWYYTTRAYGIIGLAVTCFFVLPRLFSGAHWVTDVMVGSLGIALLAMSVVIGTPFHRWFSGKCSSMLAWIFSRMRNKS